jgi:hypothetical protein
MTNTKTNPEQQDAAFYTNDDSEVVYDAGRFYVLRAGEMRIHAKKDDSDHIEVIRYTDKLLEFGIKTDTDLAEWSNKDEEIFSWVNNPWFEICDEKDEDVSIVLHELDESIALANKMAEFYGEDDEVVFFQGSVKFE